MKLTLQPWEFDDEKHVNHFLKHVNHFLANVGRQEKRHPSMTYDAVGIAGLTSLSLLWDPSLDHSVPPDRLPGWPTNMEVLSPRQVAVSNCCWLFL